MRKFYKKISFFSFNIIRLALAVLVGVIPLKAWAQNLSCFDNLLFGEIVPCGSPGTVTVTPSNSQSTGSCVMVTGAPFSRARCVVTQSFPYRPIQISVTNASYSINSGANNMAVTNFNIITNAGGNVQTVTAPFVNVPIGATLNIGSNQADGTYSGSMTVSAILQ